MNKQEFIWEVANKTCLSKKDTESTLNAIFDVIEETLAKGDKISFIGFGTFETRERAAREGRNPREPEKKIQIPATVAPVFKAGKKLKDAVKK